MIETYSALLQKINSMSTAEIIGIIFGSISIIGVIWGGIWALSKVMFNLGEYKGHLDASKKEADAKISKLSANFMSFSKEVNGKLDNISDRLSKVKGKLEK